MAVFSVAERFALLGSIAMSVGAVGLAASVAMQQSSKLSRQSVVERIERLARSTRGTGSAAGVRFDVDLIVAINEYSFATGDGVVHLMRRCVSDAVRSTPGAKILPLGSGDEVDVILPSLDSYAAIQFANSVRRAVKNQLPAIYGHADACEFVRSRLTDPPLAGEEREHIGTVSAGVAVFSRGAEALLSDMASAVKESKFRGRNKTVVFRQSGPHQVID